MTAPISIDELLGPAPAAAGASRRCVDCGQQKSTGHVDWPQYKGKPSGALCKLCKRRARIESDRKLNRAATKMGVMPVLGGQSVVAEREQKKLIALRAKTIAKRDAHIALRQEIVQGVLKQGVELLVKDAPTVMQLAFAYATDKTSIHHEWAIKLVLDRLLPRRIFEELGAKAAGVEGGLGGAGPTYIVNVVAASPGALPSGGVRVLPAPADTNIIDVTPEEEK